VFEIGFQVPAKETVKAHVELGGRIPKPAAPSGGIGRKSGTNCDPDQNQSGTGYDRLGRHL
jgi:hypothetical protein